MYQNLISKTICFIIITLLSLTTFSCGNSSSSSSKVITEADKFVSSLDRNKLTPGTETGEILTYLIDKGISGSFSMKRGDGDTRLNTYSFPDNSTIVVVSTPKSAGQGLAFVEIKIEK